jgi:hypothetical protein
MHRLAVGKIGMHPQPVCRFKVGDFRDGQSFSCALDVDFHLGADKVEGGIVGAGRRGKRQKNDEKTERGRRDAASVRKHTSQRRSLLRLG